jgi:hypothetical protein
LESVLLVLLCAGPAFGQQEPTAEPGKLAGFEEQTTLGGSGDMPARLVEDDRERIALITPVHPEPWFAFTGRGNESIGLKFGVNYNALFMGATSSLIGNDHASRGALEINANGTLLGRGGHRRRDRHENLPLRHARCQAFLDQFQEPVQMFSRAACRRFDTLLEPRAVSTRSLYAAEGIVRDLEPSRKQVTGAARGKVAKRPLLPHEEEGTSRQAVLDAPRPVLSEIQPFFEPDHRPAGVDECREVRRRISLL